MDCLSPMSPVERVVFMKAAQLGRDRDGVELDRLRHPPRAGADDGGLANGGMAKRNSKQRIDPLIEESSAGELIARRARATRATPFWPRSSGAACW